MLVVLVLAAICGRDARDGGVVARVQRVARGSSLAIFRDDVAGRCPGGSRVQSSSSPSPSQASYVRIKGARLRESLLSARCDSENTRSGARRAFAIVLRNDSAAADMSPRPERVLRGIQLAHSEQNGSEQWRDKIIREHPVVLSSAAYVAPTEHLLSATAMLTPLRLSEGGGVGGLAGWVEIDGRRFAHAVLDHGGATFAAQVHELRLPPGPHRVSLVAQGRGGGTWCSCPSAGDGFVSARHLMVWYTAAAPPLAIPTVATRQLALVRKPRTVNPATRLLSLFPPLPSACGRAPMAHRRCPPSI